MTQEALLAVRNLKKYFPIRAGLFGRVKNHVKAVDGVSFEVRAGETLGLVGESGCGKTTVGRSILRLIEPSDGELFFQGANLRTMSARGMRKIRRKMQIIFQDPYSSLNPRMTVEGIVGEALTVHGMARGVQRRQRVGELLERCGLSAMHMGRYPHEFSGGQRQRVGIARALALEPQFIVCDEAVSALDVSIQAQIINLLMDIQKEMGLSYLFIAHDLSVVEHISTRVAVMYLGRIVELAERRSLYEKPLHPYTRALLSAVPRPNPELKQERIILEGDVPTPIDPPSGCPFHTRCWLVEPRCKTDVPAFRNVGSDHWVACHLVDTKTQSLIKDGKVLAHAGGDGGNGKGNGKAMPMVEVVEARDPTPEEPEEPEEPETEAESRDPTPETETETETETESRDPTPEAETETESRHPTPEDSTPEVPETETETESRDPTPEDPTPEVPETEMQTHTTVEVMDVPEADAGAETLMHTALDFLDVPEGEPEPEAEEDEEDEEVVEAELVAEAKQPKVELEQPQPEAEAEPEADAD